MSTKELDSFLKTKTINGSHHYYKTDKRTIHYAQAGDETKPLVVFIHGSPGSLSAFIDFLADSTLTKNALAITVDRPGFGHSNYGRAEPSIRKQALALKPILEKHKENRPIILVGHSLGGPVAGYMAIEYPELVDCVVLVAASVDPELEPNELWFRAPLATPFLSWIIPRWFRASNDEIYHLKPQLEDMKPLWSTITCPVLIIHGGKDRLVPPGNVDYARNALTNSPVEVHFIDEFNHFIPWSHPELIQQVILEFLRIKPVENISGN